MTRKKHIEKIYNMSKLNNWTYKGRPQLKYEYKIHEHKNKQRERYDDALFGTPVGYFIGMEQSLNSR